MQPIYEMEYKELIQREVELKIAIRHAEEERQNIMEMQMKYSDHKQSDDPHNEQEHLRQLPWTTIRSMQKTLKELEAINHEVLTGLRIRMSDLKIEMERHSTENKIATDNGDSGKHWNNADNPMDRRGMA